MSEPLSLSEFLPYRLSVLSNTISRAIADRYAAEFGLNLGQWRVLAVVGESPNLTATEITERTVMNKVAVGRAVSGLIDMGLLHREAVQDDGRRSRLKLTTRGLDVYKRIVPIARACEADVTAPLTETERAQFNEILTKIAGAASPQRDLW